jgi:hypothetical protein
MLTLILVLMTLITLLLMMIYAPARTGTGYGMLALAGSKYHFGEREPNIYMSKSGAFPLGESFMATTCTVPIFARG